MAINISTLSNGLRVITDCNDQVDSAAIGIWVNVGTRFETPETNGIAHFLEHMAFKGTKTRSAKQIAEAVENVGGYVNASTSRENTAYYVRILKEDIDMGLDILADILQNSTFEAIEVDREREVILQEIHQSHDTPDDIIFDHFQATAYPDQAIGMPILGPQEVIRDLKRENLFNFISEKYVASRMVLAAAGNINHEHIVSMAEDKLSQITANADVVFDVAEYKGGYFTQSRDLEQLHLLLGYDGVSIEDPRYYTVAVLATVLGGGMSSRLFQEVREKRGLAYSIYTFKSCFSDSGLFGIYAGTTSQQTRELIDVVHNEVANISNNLNEDEIARARSQLKASWLMGLENVPTRCEQLAQHMIYFGRPISRAEIIDRIDAVDLESLGEIGSEIFSSAPTVAALGDIKNMPNIDSFSVKTAEHQKPKAQVS